jgi:hypothetical protein
LDVFGQHPTTETSAVAGTAETWECLPGEQHKHCRDLFQSVHNAVLVLLPRTDLPFAAN